MTQTEKPVRKNGAANTPKATNVESSNVAMPLGATKPSIYDGLSPEMVSQIKQHVEAARQHGSALKMAYIKLGQELTAIKELIEPYKEGGFKAIVEQEFGM